MEEAMPLQQFQENWKTLSNLIDTLPQTTDENMNALIKGYIDQIVMILNEILAMSSENLQRLQHAKSANEIICMHANFTNDVSKSLTISAQRFLNSTLGHIADYNEWLKLNCDLATD
jgi:hypothetical protein